NRDTNRLQPRGNETFNCPLLAVAFLPLLWENVLQHHIKRHHDVAKNSFYSSQSFQRSRGPALLLKRGGVRHHFPSTSTHRNQAFSVPHTKTSSAVQKELHYIKMGSHYIKLRPHCRK